ncbi:MAG: threonylcarbamoyl-AMP synthase [Clostridia bacterium]|nr:threonylcarbamoyl-AMP synthase [Clostridia bacterium]
MERLDARDPSALPKAASALREGRLVAFPTETVYGLGANALDDEAVLRIYRTKGRPADNPVIVHVADRAAGRALAASWPEMAEELAAAFWPGPLTLVVPRRPDVARQAAAGGATVAVRCPDHPLAIALIQAAAVPVAAPSANRSGRPSPTTADEVLRDYEGRELAPDIVLDGGPAAIGVESTVVDATGERPLVLRPGGLTLEELRRVRPDAEMASDPRLLSRSPGTRYRHYAPAKPLWLFRGPGAQAALLAAARAARAAGEEVAVLAFPDTVAALRDEGLVAPEAVALAGRRDRPEEYAARLFLALRRLESSPGAARILAEAPEPRGLGLAVADRLARAASRVVESGGGRSPVPGRVLFVCSGNTCRSPLAASLLRHLAAEAGRPVEVRSAGLAAAEGQPAPGEAVAALGDWGVDLSAHRSRRLQAADLAWADVVVCMEGWQAEALARDHPEARQKVVSWGELFGGGDVPDPFGQGEAAYRRTVDRLAADLRGWVGGREGGAP